MADDSRFLDRRTSTRTSSLSLAKDSSLFVARVVFFVPPKQSQIGEEVLLYATRRSRLPTGWYAHL